MFSENITLDKFLKWCGIAETGGHAKQLIQDGHVVVNSVPETRRSRKLYAGDIVCVEKACFRIEISEQA